MAWQPRDHEALRGRRVWVQGRPKPRRDTVGTQANGDLFAQAPFRDYWLGGGIVEKSIHSQSPEIAYKYSLHDMMVYPKHSCTASLFAVIEPCLVTELVIVRHTYTSPSLIDITSNTIDRRLYLPARAYNRR